MKIVRDHEWGHNIERRVYKGMTFYIVTMMPEVGSGVDGGS